VQDDIELAKNWKNEQEELPGIIVRSSRSIISRGKNWLEEAVHDF